MKQRVMGIGFLVGVVSLTMSMNASTLTVEKGGANNENRLQLSLNKSRIKKLFADKRFYYIDLHVKNHPIIGIAEFNASMETMEYRQIIGGKRKRSVDLILRKEGFTVLWPVKRYVKIQKVRKGFIETNNKKLFRFYKSKRAAQAYLTRQGYDVVAPRIELLGENPLKVEQYHPYIEPGAVAIDNRDGNVTVSIQAKVDVDRSGNYYITYRAKDFSGNLALKRRKVEVVPSDDNMIRVSDVTEFRQALEDAAHNVVNDIIMLEEGIYSIDADGLGTFRYNDDEENNLTIRAAEHLPRSAVVLDGNFSDRILLLNNESASTITLMNLTLRNGKTQEEGGAIRSEIPLRLINIILEKNQAEKEGGAVWLGEAATLLSIDSLFLENRSLKEGGGFYIRSGSNLPEWVGIVHSQFLKNEAFSGHGGGFAAINYDHYSSLIVENTLFRSNTARYGGGFSSRYGNAMVHNSRFFENSAEAGGAIWAYSPNISDSILRANSATTGGGALLAHDAVLNADYIVSNVSGDAGGGVWTDYLRMANTLLSLNTAQNEGASIYVKYDGYLANNTLIDNNGAAYLRRKTVLLNNVFQNPKSDWELQLGDTAYVINNYLEESCIDEQGGTIIKKYNLQPSEVGALHFVHRYVPTVNSPTIDRGLAPDSDFVVKAIDNEYTQKFFDSVLKKDLRGHPRYSIDVGALEYWPSRK